MMLVIMARLATLKPKVSTADLRKVKPPPKQADAELLTPEHRAWRKQVLERSGYQCVDCGRSDKLIADHIVERRDGGAPYDPANGAARCPSCHGVKTAKARAARLRG